MAHKADNDGVITIQPFIFINGLFTGHLTHYFYPMNFLPESWSIWIGVPLMMVSFPHSDFGF